MQFIGPREAARRLNVGFATPHRWCKQFDGFAVWVDQHWRIPAQHVDRVQAGELPSQIARRPSLPADAPISADAAGAVDTLRAARTAVSRAYLFAHGAVSCRDHRPIEVRERLLTAVTNDLLAALDALGLRDADELRDALLRCGGIEEVRQTADINLYF